MDIGQRVKSLRKAKGLSQAELSNKLGIDQSLISYLETGKGTGSSHIASIAHALGVNAHWLETGQGSSDLNYTQPTVVEKSYCKEIEEVIKLMESSDGRGRLEMLIAVQDAFEARKAWKASLPLPRATSGDDVENLMDRMALELLPDINDDERPANDVCRNQDAVARKDERH